MSDQQTEPTRQHAIPNRLSAMAKTSLFVALAMFFTWETYDCVSNGAKLTMHRSRYSGDEVTLSNTESIVYSALLALASWVTALGGVKYVLRGNTRPFPDLLRLRQSPDAEPKGSCVHCGYSRKGLRDDMPCPECGNKKP